MELKHLSTQETKINTLIKIKSKKREDIPDKEEPGMRMAMFTTEKQLQQKGK